MEARVKVCCIASVQEALMAVQYGVSAIGLVGEMPSGPGVIDDDTVREIAACVPASVDSFLLTSRDNASDIADHVHYCGVNTVQIVRHISASEFPKLVQLLPETKLVQVIHVEDESVLELIKLYEPYIDAFLLDSGRPADAVPGGTGQVHDWSISAKFVKAATKPVYLAGGLGPQNVASAIRSVRPYGLDLCSGIRTDGKLDEQALQHFMGEVAQGSADN